MLEKSGHATIPRKPAVMAAGLPGFFTILALAFACFGLPPCTRAQTPVTPPASTAGLRLNCPFQRLAGDVTPVGLWLASTVSNAPASHFQVVAAAMGREGGPLAALPVAGTVCGNTNTAQFIRPGLLEEYSVSADGVRQDFVVAASPPGTGALRLELAVNGARAEAAAAGAHFVLDGSGRKLDYSRLRVVDATGQALLARIEVASPHRLAVVVADAAAVYPIRIDPTFTATAAQSAVSASPTSVTADGTTTSTITVTLRDVNSNPVSGKTVTLAQTSGSGSPNISAASGVSSASGVVTFTVTSTTAATDVFTATDSTDSVTITQTASVTFTAGPVTAAQSAVSASPGSVTADGSTASTITVTLKDANGNPVSGKTVTLVKSSGSGNPTISAASGTSSASGVVTFTVTATIAATDVFRATDSSDSVTITQTASVTFTAGAVGAISSTVYSSPNDVPADGTTTSTITVTLADVHGNPVSGKTVTLAKTSGSGSPTISAASGPSSASGVVTFTVKSTTAATDFFNATDTSDSLAITTPAFVGFTGPVTAAQSTVSASPGSVTANGIMTSAITVTLNDANGNPVSGKTVTLAKTSGSGSPTITPVTGTSSALGVVTFYVKSTTAATDVFTATDSSDSVTITQTASVTFTSGAVTAAQSTVNASPGSVAADGTTTSTITVTLADAHGNPVSGKTVTLAKTSGSGSPTISAASGTSSASGVVTFTVKSTTAATDVFTATDSSDSIIVTQTASVTFIGPVTAAQSTLSASPASVVADGSMASTITVTLQDVNGNPVSGKTVTLAQTSGVGSPVISAASGSSSAAGVVTFTVTSTTTATDVFTATDSSDSVTITQTASVTFSPVLVTAALSTVSASPASVVADGSTTSTITVTLNDAGGNPVSGKTVTLAKTSGSGSPTISAASGTSSASGVVTFTVKSATAATDVFTATDSSDSVTITQTASVTFTAGAVSSSKSTLSAFPTSLTADGTSTSTFTVTLLDAQSNPVSGKTVTLGKISGNGIPVISAASGVSSASGVVTFTVESTTAFTGTYRSIDTSDSVTIIQTAIVTFTPGALDQSSSSATPSADSVTADGSTTSTITVNLLDAHFNPLIGKTVTLAKTSGSGNPIISAASGPSDSFGNVTFTVKSTTAAADVFTATDSSDSVTLMRTALVTFTAGPVTAAQSTVSASPGSVTADGITSSIITVTLLDANGNPVSGKTVTLAKTSGSGSPTISAASGTSSAAGVVTFTVKSTTAATDVFTATDSSDSITITQTASVTFTGPVTAAQSTVSASPTSVVADGTSTSTITVTLQDVNSNPVSGKTVTLAKTSGAGSPVISAASGPSSAAGIVTFTVRSSTPATGGDVFTAADTTDTVTVSQTATVLFTALPPVATPMTVLLPTGQTAKISLGDLATNWFDFYGYPVSLTAINFTSTDGLTVYPLNLSTSAGVYVISSSSLLGYINPAANVSDSITYTLSDGHGNLTNGVINIVGSASPLFGQTSGVVNPGGNSVTVNFAGEPGYGYNVQRSVDLITWKTIWTTNAPAAGPFNYTDTFGDLGGIAPGAAYYRLAWVP